MNVSEVSVCFVTVLDTKNGKERNTCGCGRDFGGTGSPRSGRTRGD